MKLIKKNKELRKAIKGYKLLGKSIGLVPTMGYLHEGHLSLVKRSKKDNDITVVSIFVNPLQFGKNEDLDKYPRDLKHDCKLLESKGVDILYAPEISEILGEGGLTSVYVDKLSEVLCGVTRPTHFKGVTTIVAKLFNLVTPDKAYFGEKDYQQVAIIKKMVNDLNFDIKIVGMPIIRDYDKLALSSRNTYLSGDARKRALTISTALFNAKKTAKKGMRTDILANQVIDEIKKSNLLIDYVKVVDSETLQEVNIIDRDITILVAIKVDSTRLIDNISIKLK